MAQERDKEAIRVFHGAQDPNMFETLRAWGPSPNRSFFVTPNRSLAIEAAGGKKSRVLEYNIPINQAKKILGKEEEYLGQIGEGKQYEIPSSVARELHRYLHPSQKISA